MRDIARESDGTYSRSVKSSFRGKVTEVGSTEGTIEGEAYADGYTAERTERFFSKGVGDRERGRGERKRAIECTASEAVKERRKKREGEIVRLYVCLCVCMCVCV